MSPSHLVPNLVAFHPQVGEHDFLIGLFQQLLVTSRSCENQILCRLTVHGNLGDPNHSARRACLYFRLNIKFPLDLVTYHFRVSFGVNQLSKLLGGHEPLLLGIAASTSGAKRGGLSLRCKGISFLHILNPF